jgi:hypothetical protein
MIVHFIWKCKNFQSVLTIISVGVKENFRNIYETTYFSEIMKILMTHNILVFYTRTIYGTRDSKNIATSIQFFFNIINTLKLLLFNGFGIIC